MLRYTELQHNGKVVKLYGDDFEQEAIGQIRTMAETELADVANIAIMPDAHAGAGICIGFTARWTQKKSEAPPPISPDWIGVDIGCGVICVVGDLKEELDFSKIDKQIRRDVKLGFDIHNNPLTLPPNVDLFFDPKQHSYILRDALSITDKIDSRSPAKSLGTLGGGNHFIEIGKSEEGNTALIIHTGSRNFGLSVANYHSKKAKALYGDRMLRTTEEINEYIHDMEIAQRYAEINRRLIAASISYHLFTDNIGIIESAHNNITIDHESAVDNVWTIRKGAISAEQNSYVVIPANMKDGTLVAQVLWPSVQAAENVNYSLPHGSGRTMSRSKAKAEIDLESFKDQMKDVWSSSISESTLDEAPDAYKDTNEIRNKILPVLRYVEIFKPIYNLKG